MSPYSYTVCESESGDFSRLSQSALTSAAVCLVPVSNLFQLARSGVFECPGFMG